MGLYDYLLNKYGYNEPIFLKDISYNDYSVPWIKKTIGQLCGEDKIVRFEKGIYYIPKKTILGKSKLDSREVIVRKYVNDGNRIIGYFSGPTFMNMIGISTQMPNTWEIYTNNEKSRVREVVVGSQNAIIRRSRGNINNKNAATMSLLELMNCTNSAFYDDEKKAIVASYIMDSGVSRSTISECAPIFPDKAMRTMVESGIIYEVTQR